MQSKRNTMLDHITAMSTRKNKNSVIQSIGLFYYIKEIENKISIRTLTVHPLSVDFIYHAAIVFFFGDQVSHDQVQVQVLQDSSEC